MKRYDLVEKIREVGVKNPDLQEILEEEVMNTVENFEIEDLKRAVRSFICKFRSKYEKCSRMMTRMIQKEKVWLDGDMYAPAETTTNSTFDFRSGRPEKNWIEASNRTKRKRVHELKDSNCTLALTSAAISRSKDSPGNRKLFDALKQSVKDPEKVRLSLESSEKYPKMMSTEDALALKIQCDLSDSQYQILRNATMKQNANIFPSLKKILAAKSACYPDDTEISETSAKCSLQSMLDHTASRILQLNNQNSSDLEPGCSGTLYLKAGMDGASQTIYNQKFEETELEVGKNHEETLFQTAIVPLKLVVNEKDVWVNQKPSSSHFCRPLHLQYRKETKETTQMEQERINQEIDVLEDFSIDLIQPNGEKLNGKIKYKVEMTMLDGKAVNALTNTLSTQSCNVCKAKPSEMNKLEIIRSKPVNEKSLKFGLSSLHCWIRCFEYILHLAYKLENQTFQARTVEEKESVVRRKAEIKKKFREQLSLVVDTPK